MDGGPELWGKNGLSLMTLKDIERRCFAFITWYELRHLINMYAFHANMLYQFMQQGNSLYFHNTKGLSIRNCILIGNASEESKDCFYGKLEDVYDTIQRRDFIAVFGDLNTIWRKNALRDSAHLIRKESLHKVSKKMVCG